MTVRIATLDVVPATESPVSPETVQLVTVEAVRAYPEPIAPVDFVVGLACCPVEMGALPTHMEKYLAALN